VEPFSDRTWPEVESAAGRHVALLPVGSTEAHGPHLPLSTDTIIAEGVARAAGARLEERGVESWILPPVSYTITDCAAEFAGTVSVSVAAVRTLLEDLARSLGNQGFRVLGLVNGHLEPAHRQVLRGLAEADHGGLEVVFPDYVRRRYAGRLGEEFLSGACHAGAYETSIVLALRPDLVRLDLARGLEENPISLGRALAEGKTTFRAAGGPEAYFGAPALATAEDGWRWVAELAAIVADEVLARLGEGE
jgi:creatinine amidohydrolase